MHPEIDQFPSLPNEKGTVAISSLAYEMIDAISYDENMHFPLLEEADHRIVISGINGPNKRLLEDLNDLNYVISEEPHGVGWQKEVKNILINLIPHDYRFF